MYGRRPSDGDTGEEEVANAAFALGSAGETCFQESQAPVNEEEGLDQGGIALGWCQVQEHLNRLDVAQWTSSWNLTGCS